MDPEYNSNKFRLKIVVKIRCVTESQNISEKQQINVFINLYIITLFLISTAHKC